MHIVTYTYISMHVYSVLLHVFDVPRVAPDPRAPMNVSVTNRVTVHGAVIPRRNGCHGRYSYRGTSLIRYRPPL